MSRPPARWLEIAVGLCFAAFAFYLVHSAASRCPQYDDAYNASVAKNVALGFGYASSYHERVPFDPDVSVGPTIILPAALAFHLLGHSLSSPMVGMVTLNCLLLVCSYFAFRRMFGVTFNVVQFSLYAIFLLASVNQGDTGRFGFWLEVAGEVAGGLLAVIGTVLVLSAESNQRAGFFALGLAILTKTYYGIGALVVILAFLRLELGSSRKARARNVALALLSLISPFVVWSAWQLFSLPAGGLADHLSRELRFFWSGGSGFANLWNA